MKPSSKNTAPQNTSACSSPGCCGGVSRREALKVISLSAVTALTANWPVMAGPFTREDFEKLVPADKKLDPAWVKSLFVRGSREVYRGAELENIGMPIGGICTGQLYLGGDGKLWHWDIFNKHTGTGDSHYKTPLKPVSPLEQGFALRVTAGGKSEVRTLDRSGFSDISFCGEYPMAFVEYRDAALPVAVSLEAFSPFVPLKADDSNLPATVMRYTLKNTGAAKVECEIAGWIENAVCLHTGFAGGDCLRRNRVKRDGNLLFLECSAEALPREQLQKPRPEIVFESFEKPAYEDWTVTGTAFGTGPVERKKIYDYQGQVGGEGNRVVNSHASAPGKAVGDRDNATGRLASREFTLERKFISFYIGGGKHPGKTCLNLIVGGKVVRTATGDNSNLMRKEAFDVRELEGKSARIEIVDDQQGPWGNIGVDQIVFTDTPTTSAPLEKRHDFGTMGLGLLDATATDATALSLPAGNLAEEIFPAQGTESDATKPFGSKLVGALKRKLALEPGASATVTFLIAWHFPNDDIKSLKATPIRRYATRFPSAAAVAGHIAKHFTTLSDQTRLWHDTWYDSTLPYWFLNRTFLNTSILATSTSHWFADNRFYGWEGVGCCAGTCTHVWHYAHAMGRIFPELERSLRELTDYGIGFDEETGRIRFRAEHNNHWAVDGQTGTILRVLREHQMSGDDKFLRRIWPRVKKSLEFLISKDEGADGIVDGPQHNTLDADWWGEVAWLSGLYVAALRAGEEMAREMGDTAFAEQCHGIFERGRRNISARLFNGEYFIHRGDAAHAKTAVGSYEGCEIDQVFGQSWAWQVALGRVLENEKTKTALQSLWRYNFSPDVGPYREVHKRGRWYAMAGEAGLLMCTWPKGEQSRVPVSYDYYFNECMNGFEHQVAGHMIWEGMVQEGLAIIRAVHDRYHPSRRNPWNEVECGDHYARSMASYGVFLAACGFECHGPKGHIGFAPRLTPDHFRAAFTSADGWGMFEQKTEGGTQRAEIVMKHGKLRLRTVALAAPNGKRPSSVKVSVNSKSLDASRAMTDDKILVTLDSDAILQAGERMVIEFN